MEGNCKEQFNKCKACTKTKECILKYVFRNNDKHSKKQYGRLMNKLEIENPAEVYETS